MKSIGPKDVFHHVDQPAKTQQPGTCERGRMALNEVVNSLRVAVNEARKRINVYFPPRCGSPLSAFIVLPVAAPSFVVGSASIKTVVRTL